MKWFRQLDACGRVVIDLTKFVVPSETLHVFAGRLEGRAIRHLHQITPYDAVRVVIPEGTLALTTSFIIGLIADTQIDRVTFIGPAEQVERAERSLATIHRFEIWKDFRTGEDEKLDVQVDPNDSFVQRLKVGFRAFMQTVEKR